jgi:propionate CoA-transferase
MAQADRVGNVNVSRFGSKLAGSGGFINISQNAKRLVFVGTFVVPSRCRIQDGRLVIADGAVAPKFLRDVEQRTFSGEYAAQAGQPVLYVTDRCVFQLTPDGLELIEVAPWLDLERDVLAHIGFEPIIHGEPKLMDARIFADEPMGLKDDLLTCRSRHASPTTPSGTSSSSTWRACPWSVKKKFRISRPRSRSV